MTKITKKEKTLREGINKWKNFLNEGAFKSQVQEARMGEYGKIDAEDGNPPTKIGRGNEEYMAAYNAVLQARGEQPLDIQKPDQAFLDALRSGRLEEGDAEFKVGDEVIANGRNGTITDLSIPGMATVDLGRQGETTVSLSDIEHRFYKGDFGMELYDIDENITDVKVGDKVNIIGGAVVGAYGEVIELTKLGGIGAGPDAGLPAFVVKLEGDADKRIYGAAGDEVIIQPKFVQKMRMGDPDIMYGSDDEYDDLMEDKIRVKWDLEGMSPEEAGVPTVVEIPQHLKDEAEDEEELDDLISDWLSDTYGWTHFGWQEIPSAGMTERSADDDRDLEEPVKYGTGHELEWDPKEEKLYDRKRDYYLSQEEEDAVVAARQAEIDRRHKEFDMRRQNREFGSAPYHFEEGNENFSAKTEGANPAMNLQSKAKGKAMGLLQTAKAMAQAPSTEPARGFAAAVAKGAGEIVDLMVELEGYQVAGYMEESAWGRGETGGMEHAANLIRDARNAIDRLLDREYELTSDNADWEMIVKGLSEALYIINQPMKEGNEPFDMDAHMAAYENEPETIEYRKQINRLIQMVADKKGIPVEQAAEEIASYAVTYQNMKESQGGNKVKEAIGMQNIEKRRKPTAAPAAGAKINPTTTAKQFIKDKGYDKYFDLSDVFKVMALTDYLRKAGANTEEKVQAAVIDYIQHDGQSLKEGVGDKETRIRDVVKMGSWDNIDGVPLSLPQAELLVAAMDNLNDTNKKKLMAMPINKMLDIVNKMVDAGVITVDYGRAGLREMMGAPRTTLDQIEDIARTKLEKGGRLVEVASELQAEGFDATMSSGAINIDGKYFIGKESMFDISPNEDVRRMMGFVLGNIG